MITEIDINDYNYNLPEDRIAYRPLGERSQSKLLFADARNSTINHFVFSDIVSLIPEGSMLIKNITKVIAARLNLRKATGGAAELLCIEPVSPSQDPMIAMQSRGKCVWNCIVGGRNIKAGDCLHSEHGSPADKFEAKILSRSGNMAEAEFTWSPAEKTFAEVIALFGTIPLPPYIKRETTAEDISDYQTVFAQYEGSVAAPTAGLHFTDEILDGLARKNINSAELTLHVGPGTFLPVESDKIADHQMHSEKIVVSIKTLKLIVDYLQNKPPESRLIATGTTSLRTLESIFWFGVMAGKGERPVFLDQWYPYTNDSDLSFLQSLDYLIKYLEEQHEHYLYASTALFIFPGYTIRTADGLITNFHLPKSTLLLLVSAFVGDEFRKKIYSEALQNSYRFLSYGDASLLLR